MEIWYVSSPFFDLIASAQQFTSKQVTALVSLLNYEQGVTFLFYTEV